MTIFVPPQGDVLDVDLPAPLPRAEAAEPTPDAGSARRRRATAPVDTTVELRPVTLPNPIVAASGTVGHGAERAQLCEECAPDMGEAAAAVQAQVAVEQLWQKARETDQTQGADLSSGLSVAVCPSCNARLKPGAKFCSECGVAIQPKKQHCATCGVELSDGARFCSGCGASV